MRPGADLVGMKMSDTQVILCNPVVVIVVRVSLLGGRRFSGIGLVQVSHSKLLAWVRNIVVKVMELSTTG